MQLESKNENRLFLVVLGGRTRRSHIELHDVRWVVGKKIEDVFPQLSKEWFGDSNGLHMDSFMEIKFIDGYKVSLISTASNVKSQSTLISKSTPLTKMSLWFVNLGGYNNAQLNELHEFGLVVAKTSSDAKRIAKERFLKGCKLLHNDDIYNIDKRPAIDDCHSIKYIPGWRIVLTLDPNKRSQKLRPDWYGFRLIGNEIQETLDLNSSIN